LFVTLTNYTNISKIALIEKYSEVGKVNSNSKNNSQTLHTGDIETNYTYEKAKVVKPAAMMVPSYVKKLPKKEQDEILFQVPKIILAVGEEEVNELRKRYEEFKNLYPDLKPLEAKEIAKVEPNIMKARKKNEKVFALYTTKGYAVNYKKLSESFVKQAMLSKTKTKDLLLEHKVSKIEKSNYGYKISTNKGKIEAKAVVVDADSYSLLFAKSLGYGEEYSLIPIAGSFYFSPEVLKGKVYTMQDKKLPFAAVHADPDVKVPNKTRWGPTAKFFPVLESGKLKTSLDYFKSSGLLRFKTIKSFAKILGDWARLKYLLKNMSYDIPIIGKRLFMPNIQKIVPSMKASDIKIAKGFGGMRLQRVDTNTHELQLGEGKILGDNILFNMTPSPGATVCLYNATRDAKTVIKFLGKKYKFNNKKMEKDFSEDTTKKNGVSANFYSS
jgi:malate dehydrogenase (quinone)